MSRTQARLELDPAQLAAQMAGRTWQAAHAGVLLDEAPAAYKPIDQVMADQEDLVMVEHVLRQVLNYKGVEPPRPRRAKEGS